MRRLLLSLLLLLPSVLCAQTQPNLTAQIRSSNPAVYLNLNDAAASPQYFTDSVSGQQFIASSNATVPAPVDRYTGIGASFADTGTNTANSLTMPSVAGFPGGFWYGGYNGQLSMNGTPWQVTDTSSFNPDGSHAFSYVLVFQMGLSGSAGNPGYIFNTQGTTGQGMHISVDGDGTIEFYLAAADGTAIIVRSPPGGLPSNSPTRMAFTYDGSRTAAGVKIWYFTTPETLTTVQDNLSSGSTATSVPMTFGGNIATVSHFNNNWSAEDIRNYDFALSLDQLNVIFAGDYITGTGVGTIAAHQAGFDPSQPGNASASLTNAYIKSPDGTLANYATGNPYSVLVHVNAIGAGDRTLAAKSGYFNLFWAGHEFCFQIPGNNGFCTRPLPDGYNYDVIATTNNTGGDWHDIALYVNGLPMDRNFDTGGFGGAAPQLPRPFGGDGVIYIGGYNGGQDSGTGLNVDEFAIFPGIVDQYFIQSEFVHTKFYLSSGIGSLPTNPPDLIIDEDGCTDPDNIAALNLTIKAHKLGYIKLRAVIDSDIQIASHRLYRDILDSNGLAHVPLGLAQGATYSSNPMASVSASYYGAKAADGIGSTILADVFNASVPDSYSDSTTVLRKVVAALPAGHKLAIMSGGSSASISAFMQAPADSISSEDGPTMWANHILEVYFQGTGNLIGEDSTPSAYVLSHNGSVPLYFFDNGDAGSCCTPPNTGPGFAHTRSPRDPLRLMVDSGWGGETRSGWDSLPTVNFLTGVFHGTCTTGTATIVAGTNNAPSFTGASSYSWNPSVNSNHYACPLSSLSDPSAGMTSNVFTWFVNSIANGLSQGQPRADAQ